MAEATFSGHSGFKVVAQAGRSGKDVYVDTWVERTSSYTAWSTAQQTWYSSIHGEQNTHSWTYDFRNTTSIYLGRRWKYNLPIGNIGWAITVYMASGIGSASVSGTITVPPDAPSAPTLGTITRNSDTSQTINWTRNASGSAPYDSQQVQRMEYGNSGWGGWTVVANLGGSSAGGAQSYTDTTTSANKIYHYRVVGINSAGAAYSGMSDWVFTTPASPTSVALAAVPGNQVKATIAVGVPHGEYKTELQYSSAGGAWTALTTLNRGVTEYTWTPPVGASIQVRARHSIDATGRVGHGLLSTYRDSNIVPLQSPPLAPTNLAPNGVNVDFAKTVTLSWTYTSTDTSDQVAYEIETKAGAGAWTSRGKVTSSAKQHTFAIGTFAKNVAQQWRVKVWGAHATASPVSSLASFTAVDAPAVTITSPLGVADTATATVTWTPIAGQANWKAELYRESDLLEAKAGSGAASSVTFGPQFLNGGNYTIKVQVQGSTGLWSPWATTTFVVDFPEPGPAEVALGWDTDRGAVLVTMNNLPGEATSLFNTIYRSYDQQEWELVADSVPLNASVSDSEVVLNTDVYYRVRTTSTLGTVIDSVIRMVRTTTLSGYWAVGPNFSMSLPLRLGLGDPPSIDLETGLAARELHYFAGRTLPVEFAGVARQRTGEASFMVPTLAERNQALQMSYMPAPHLFRLPDGTFIYASIDPVSSHREDEGFYTIEVPLTEVAK